MSIIRLESSCLDDLNLPDIPRIALKLKAAKENRSPDSICTAEIASALKTYKIATGQLQFNKENYNAQKI